jgi:hypothetical protein
VDFFGVLPASVQKPEFIFFGDCFCPFMYRNPRDIKCPDYGITVATKNSVLDNFFDFYGSNGLLEDFPGM